MQDQETRVYPIQTTDGFYYEDEVGETMSIETKKYDNGKEVKRIKLSDGSIAMVRELAAWEMEDAPKVVGKNEADLYSIALAAHATKIDDKQVTFEELKFMRAKDWLKIKTANAINFI